MRTRWVSRSTNLFAAVGVCDLAAYWTGVARGLHPVVFVLGATLAFYLPGTAIVAAMGDVFGHVSIEERAAMSVVFSIAFNALAALTLDFTPLGITQTALAAADSGLIVVACVFVLARERRSRPAAPAGNVERTVLVLLVSLMAGGWGLGASGFGGAVAKVDSVFQHSPPPDYSEFVASCTYDPATRDAVLEFVSIPHGGLRGPYRLSIRLDRRHRSDVRLGGGLTSGVPVHYRLQVRGPWKKVAARLTTWTAGPSVSPSLRTSLRPQACRVGSGVRNGSVHRAR